MERVCVTRTDFSFKMKGNKSLKAINPNFWLVAMSCYFSNMGYKYFTAINFHIYVICVYLIADVGYQGKTSIYFGTYLIL